MPGMLVALSVIYINKDCLKDRLKRRYFGENEKFLMVKSENEVRVFLLADFLTDGAEKMILVKEVAWREGLCSFKNKEKMERKGI